MCDHFILLFVFFCSNKFGELVQVCVEMRPVQLQAVCSGLIGPVHVSKISSVRGARIKNATPSQVDPKHHSEF